MYELWLTANIAWELVREAGWGVPVGLAAWVGVMGWALRPGAPRRPSLGAAAIVGSVGAVLAFALLPRLTASSLGELRYVVDVLAMLGMALAAGGVAGLFAWPLLSLRKPRAD